MPGFSPLRRVRARYDRWYADAWCKDAFIRSCPPGARLLDVGCGNNSPRYTKEIRPDLVYTGLDVGDYNQAEPAAAFADRYLVVPPERFAAAIEAERGAMDAVVSAHNLEHCLDMPATLAAMAGALAPGGRLFLAFPCEASARFPSRDGCLNFFDDATHRRLPRFDDVLAGLRGAGLEGTVAIPRYRPGVHVLAGLRHEWRSRRERRVLEGTWALWGFESVVWARRGMNR